MLIHIHIYISNEAVEMKKKIIIEISPKRGISLMHLAF